MIGVIISKGAAWSTGLIYSVRKSCQPGNREWWDRKTHRHGIEIMLFDHDIVEAVLEKDKARAVRIAKTKIDVSNYPK